MPVATKTDELIDQLYQIKGKAEIVNGEIVHMSPTGGMPGEAGVGIVVSLRNYARRTGQGRAVPDNVAFIVNLPHRRSF